MKKKMKGAVVFRNFFFLFVGILCGANAYATRARLQALGQDSNGSLFISDERNIFLNPAYLNRSTDLINFEAGVTDYTDHEETERTTNDPKAEGGIAYVGDGFNYALQLGRVSTEVSSIVNQESLGTVLFFDPQNAVEVLIAGEASIGWGASLYYASSESYDSSAGGDSSEGQAISLRGGVHTDTFQAYGNWGIIHEAKNELAAGPVTQEYDGGLSLELGGSYNFQGDGSIGGYIRWINYDFNDGAAVEGEASDQIFSLTYFHRLRQTEGYFVFASGGLYWQENESEYDGAGTTSREENRMSLPVTLGFESVLTEWLAFRGSVSQHILIHKDEFKDGTNDIENDNLDSTVVGLGASIHFENFSLDGTLEGSTSGDLNANTLLANMGVTYSY